VASAYDFFQLNSHRRNKMRNLASAMFGAIAVTLSAPGMAVAVPITSGMGASAVAAAKIELATPVYYRRGGGYRVARAGIYRGGYGYRGYYGGYRRHAGYGGYYRPYRSYAYSYPYYATSYAYPYYSYGYGSYASYYPYASYGYSYPYRGYGYAGFRRAYYW
jgi:hypothetical protein